VALIDIGQFHDGKKDCLIPDMEIETRKALVLSHLSKCLFDPKTPGFGRGEGSFIPDRHQLLAIENFINPWLGDIFSSTINGTESLDINHRNEFILADEGGMGKTFSSVIAALHHLKESKGKESVLVLCSPMVKDNWYRAFKSCNIKVSRKSASVLSEDTLDNGVTIISKHSLQHHPITNDAGERLSRKIALCIIDEAHEGMITEINGPPLRESIEVILNLSNKNLIVTATPIRKNWGDLKRLLEGIVSDENDLNRLREFNFSEQWMKNLAEDWLPAINRLGSGNLTTQDISYITDNIENIIPLINDNEIACLKNNLPIVLRNYDNIGDTNRERIARDLHPFGKYMSISLRDDLGKNKCEELYRKKYSRSIIIKHWSELKQLTSYLENKNWKYDKNILFSSPENVFKIDSEGRHYYRSLKEIDKRENDVERLIKAASDNDPRFFYLKEICETSKSNHIHGQKAGVVVFCNFEGTTEKISSWCKANGYNAFSFQELNRNEQNERTRNHNLIRKGKILKKAEEDSLRNNKTTVFICGKDAAVGLNMAWANHIVHWDIEYGAVENINQRTWRLDRRWNGSDIINQEFYVTYLVMENRIDKMIEANKNFIKNRILLGDRRFFDSNSDNINNLFVENNSEWIENSWTDTAKGDSITTNHVREIWDWCQGRMFDNSGIAENMWLCSLKEITGINLDLTNAEKEIIVDSDNLGITNTDLHDLIALSSSEERPSLLFISSGYKNTNSVMTQFGIPNIEPNKTTITLLPDGVLATKFRDYLREKFEHDLIPMNTYPYWIRSGGDRDLAYAIHLGILEIMETERGNILSNLLGSNFPSGIIVNENGEGWKHVLKSDLKNHIENFEMMLIHTEEIADDLPNRSIEEDISKFLSMEELKDLSFFNWTKHSSKMTNQELRVFLMESDSFEQLLGDVTTKEYMLPILVIQRNGEKHNSCHSCGTRDNCSEERCNSWKGEVEGWI